VLAQRKSIIIQKNPILLPMKKIILLLTLSLWVSSLSAMDLKREINLKGEWRFEIGDNPVYKEPGFDDSRWEKINVPSAWENEGFPGYDGYAWYRTSFYVPENLKDKKLYLLLGRIDDVDRAYLNGKLICGKGEFPPNYKSAWEERRKYRLSPEDLKFGETNVLAVKVYDYHKSGGIIDGDVGIYSRRDVLELKIDLSGEWKFATGDDMKRAQPGFDDSKWKDIKVPSYWERHGFKRYDGIAWYRKHVQIPDSLAQVKLILMLGKINDIDEAYGDHKAIYKGRKNIERAYFIPPDLIRANQDNVIAVRVMDVGKYGGIYKGYVGITTRQEYLKYSKRK